ncbi:MAG: hypothetical protein J2P48_08270 [Alphaproteobacteria bacterium]|nr:hypothetical protein [Alphaproteobacteria bacterium]
MAIQLLTNIDLEAEPVAPQHVPHIQWVTDYVTENADVAEWGHITGSLEDQEDLHAALGELDGRITGLANLGSFVGSFDTRDDLPADQSGFTHPITVNDFATVRADETQGNATTRYVATAIAGGGEITWVLDLTYSTDVTGKMALVPAATAGHFAAFDGAGQVVDGGDLGGKAETYAESITGDGTATTFAVDHELGTSDVSVNLRNLTTNAVVWADVTVNNANRVTIGFAAPPTTGTSFRVVVMG